MTNSEMTIVLVIVAVFLVTFAIQLIAMWRIYQKAGQPGWHSIVPILNIITLCRIIKRPDWWVVLWFIPLVNIVVGFIFYMDLAKVFGKDSAFGIGLILLPWLFFPILGLGSAQYIGGTSSYGTSSFGSPHPQTYGDPSALGGVGRPPAQQDVGYTGTPPWGGTQQSWGTNDPYSGSSSGSDPSQPQQEGPPAGWYPDPSGTGQRWWDGRVWTDHVSG